MYIGKLAVFLWIFSGIILFVGYMWQQAMGDTIFTGSQIDNLTALIDRTSVANSTSLTPTTSIIGAYITGADLVFNGLLSGDIIGQVINQIPVVSDEAFYIMVRFLYSVSSFFFFVNIITGRDI